MDLLHDLLAAPHGIARALAADGNSANPVDSSRARSVALGLLAPLRHLLLSSKHPRSRSPSPAPETPPHAADGQTTHQKYRIQVLRVKLDEAQTSYEWLAAATELDALEGHDAWKLDPCSDEYDVQLIRDRLREMDDTRISHDHARLLNVIRNKLDRRLGGTHNVHLYKHSRLGTKALIEQYIASVQETIDALVDMTVSHQGGVPSQRVYQDLLLTRQQYGRTALLLSGGGTFGMNHIGVIKSLFEANLLPRIVSGASAGSIVAAVLCTKLDEEVPKVLKEFCFGDLAVFEKPGKETSLLSKAYRFMTAGSLFDISNLIGVMKELLGDMTFRESYKLTRRILNICVSPASAYELPRLLNYVTSPDVIIWSAVAASCSVPFIFSPAQLLAKDPNTGTISPWNLSPQCWIDGSVENDIPIQRIAEMFNVNHFIVSQVNPHVVPFLEKDEDDLIKEAQDAEAGRKSGPGWGHAATVLARDEVMHRLAVLEELGIVPNFVSKIRAVVGQKYSGDITIFPKISYANFPYVLSNPNTEFMLQATLSGEKATWPKLSEIRNHCTIELAIDDAVHRLLDEVPHEIGEIDEYVMKSKGVSLETPVTKAAQSRYESIPRVPVNDATSRAIKMALAMPKEIQPKRSDKRKPAKKTAGPDLHDFSDSELEKLSDLGNWQLSADESPSDSTDEASPATMAAQWSLLRTASRSLPATPGAPPMGLAITSTAPSQHTGAKSAPNSAHPPSSPELIYKALFHPQLASEVPSSHSVYGGGRMSPIKARSRSSLELDLSGTRGMHRRRKNSVGRAVKFSMADDDDDDQ